MPKGQYKKAPIKFAGEKGIYNRDDWLKESQIHLLSAKMLRKCSAEKKELIAERMKHENQSKPCDEKIILISQKEAGNKSSMLLLGYAFEMILKSGLAYLYKSLPRKTLLKDLKKYSHQLRLLAEEIEAPLDDNEFKTLDVLSEWIRNQARYPVEPKNDRSYNKQWNELIRKFWDDRQFEAFVALYEKIHSHILTIEGGEDDHLSLRAWKIDNDGCLTYRTGGNLRDRIMVKYSSQQKEKEKDNRESLKRELPNIVDSFHEQQLSDCWETSVFKEIKDE